MTILAEKEYMNRAVILDYPVAGLTSPEFQEFAKLVIAAIGRSTRRAVSHIGAGLVGMFAWIKKKSSDAAEMHNRATAELDNRYSRNWYYIRSAL